MKICSFLPSATEILFALGAVSYTHLQFLKAEAKILRQGGAFSLEERLQIFGNILDTDGV